MSEGHDPATAIGTVTHYFSHLSVAAVTLTDALRVGDRIHIVAIPPTSSRPSIRWRWSTRRRRAPLRAMTSRWPLPTMFAITIAFTAKPELPARLVIIGQRTARRAQLARRSGPSPSGCRKPGRTTRGASRWPRSARRSSCSWALTRARTDGPFHRQAARLPRRGALPFTETPGYGLDRGHCDGARLAGCPAGDAHGWIEESYRAVAPRALARAPDGA